MLAYAEKELTDLAKWNHDSLLSALTGLADRLQEKNALVMWPVRIAISGTLVTPGGAVEILVLLGKQESLRRIALGRQRLST